MIIDYDGISLDELCDGIYIDAQVRIEENTEGADYMYNTYTSTYVDGDIYMDTPDGSFVLTGKFAEYLESLLIDKAKQEKLLAEKIVSHPVYY